MPLISVVLVLVVIGLLLWAVQSIVPMDAKIKQIINVLVIVVVCLWLLSLFFGMPNLGGVKVGR